MANFKRITTKKNIERSVDPSHDRPKAGTYAQYQGVPGETDYSWNNADMNKENWKSLNQINHDCEGEDDIEDYGDFGKYQQRIGTPQSSESDSNENGGNGFEYQNGSKNLKSLKDYLRDRENVEMFDTKNGFLGDYNQYQSLPGSAYNFSSFDDPINDIDTGYYDLVSPNPLRYNELKYDGNAPGREFQDSSIDIDYIDSYENVRDSEKLQQSVIDVIENTLGDTLQNKPSDKIYQMVMKLFEKKKIQFYEIFGIYFDYFTKNNIAIVIANKYGIDNKEFGEKRISECINRFKRYIKDKKIYESNTKNKSVESLVEELCKGFGIYKYDFNKRFSEYNGLSPYKWARKKGM